MIQSEIQVLVGLSLGTFVGSHNCSFWLSHQTSMKKSLMGNMTQHHSCRPVNCLLSLGCSRSPCWHSGSMSTCSFDQSDTWHSWHHCSWGMSNRRSLGYSRLDSRRMLGSHCRLCRFVGSMSTVSACCRSRMLLCHHTTGSTVHLQCWLLQGLVSTGHKCIHKEAVQPCWCCRWGQTGLERQMSWRKLPGLG